MNYRALVIGILMLSLFSGVALADKSLPTESELNDFIVSDTTQESNTADYAYVVGENAVNKHPDWVWDIWVFEFAGGESIDVISFYYQDPSFSDKFKSRYFFERGRDDSSGIDKVVTSFCIGSPVKICALEGCSKSYDIDDKLVGIKRVKSYFGNGKYESLSGAKTVSVKKSGDDKKSDVEEDVDKESTVKDVSGESGETSIYEYSKKCESGNCDTSGDSTDSESGELKSDAEKKVDFDEDDLPWNDKEYDVEDESTKEKIDTFMKFYKAGMTDSDTVEKCLYYLFSKNEKND